MRNSILLALFLMVVSTISVSAQNTMYFMDRLPQNISYNPAFVPEVKFYLGLPGIGGVAAHAYNSGFNYSELEGFMDNLGNEGYNADEFVNSIGDYNSFFAEAKANILSMGFKLKEKGYFSIGISANDVTANKASSKIAYLLANVDDIEDEDFPIIIDKIDFLTNNYLSLGITYSRIINEHLTLGINPHINFNEIGIKTSNIGYNIELEKTEFDKDYNQTLLGEVALGMPVEINPDAIDGDELDLDQDLFPENWVEDLTVGDLLRNASFSLDVGATYAIDKWALSASILNIGSSSWKTNGYNIFGNDEIIRVKKNDKTQIGIPVKIYLGANRQFSPKWNYGLVFNNTFYNTGSNSSATLSLNGYIGSLLSTSISYTAGYRFNNVGLGFRMRFFPGMDLYFVTDNIIQMLNYKKAYRASAAFGINLSFGVKNKSIENTSSDESSI